MKKKIIYGLLLAVAMVTATSSFVSCKDYEGDDLAAIREKIAIDGINSQATLDELIKTQLSLAQAQLESLLEAIGNLKANDPMRQAAGSQADAYQALLAQYQQDYQNASTIADKIAVLNKLTQLLANLNGTAGSTPGTVAVPSATEIIIAMWGDSLYNAYHWADSAYRRAQILSDSIKATDILSKDNKYRLDTLSLRAYQLFKDAKSYTDQATLIMYQQVLAKLTQDSTDVYAKIKADSIALANAIENAQNQLTQDRKADSVLFENKLADLDQARKTDSTKFEQMIADLKTKMKADSTTLHEALIDSISDLETRMMKALADSITNIDEKFTVRCNDIEAGYKAAVQDLQGQLDNLSEKVKGIEEDIANILGVLKKQITGIIVQGTYSPVFGYGSLPLGVQTNILAAYAGKAVVTGKFPSLYGGNYANGKNVFTEDDVNYIGSIATETITEGDLLINEEEGNAGKMYLTVNPTNIDFSGTDFFLVNSQGEESRIKLSKLNASDDVLSFGWTRGTTVGKESANGFYEVAATIDAGDALKMQPRFDKAGFKQAVKDAIDGQKRLAVKDAARALFNSLQPVDRFGVKAEWIDTVTTNDKTAKRSVMSALDVAALSVEPLGFGFNSLNGIVKLPTIDSKFISSDLHIDLSIGDIKVTPNPNGYKVTTDVHLVGFNENLVKFNETTKKYEFVGDAGTYEIVTVGGKDVSLLNKDQLINLFRQGDVIEIDVTDFVNEIYGEFNAELDKINFSGTTENINKQIDKIFKTVNSYIDRANSWINRLNNLFNNLSSAIQPVLLWSDGEKAGELGGIVSANYAVGKPVKAGSDLILIPTSYSLELFAPAYKKSLIVTNAYDFNTGSSAQKGNATLKAAADALSAQLKDYVSFNGVSNGLNAIQVNVGTKTGITYEIAYTALDYEGKVAGRKFYITVVE